MSAVIEEANSLTKTVEGCFYKRPILLVWGKTILQFESQQS